MELSANYTHEVVFAVTAALADRNIDILEALRRKLSNWPDGDMDRMALALLIDQAQETLEELVIAEDDLALATN